MIDTKWCHICPYYHVRPHTLMNTWSHTLINVFAWPPMQFEYIKKGMLYHFKLALGFTIFWWNTMYSLIKHIDKSIQHSLKIWQSIDKGSKSYCCAPKNPNLIHHIIFAIEHWISCLLYCPVVQNRGSFWMSSLIVVSI